MTWDEWLAQAAWTALWLIGLERGYGALRAATVRGAEDAGGRETMRFVVASTFLVPLTIVFEASAQWAANHLLYHPGSAELVFRGWLRGLIDTSAYALHIATNATPLSEFARRVLGWQDELHPFAVVVCAAMAGDVVWAMLAMAVGGGRLRDRAPVLARAFRLAGLAAATAPLSTLAYFTLRGGDGLNVWSGVMAVLVGTMDAGGQVPTWVRVYGTLIFYGFPLAMLAWRLRIERRTLLPAERLVSAARRPRAAELGSMPILATVTVPLVGIWALNLSAGPFSWLGQAVFLGLWLALLAACSGWMIAMAGGPAPRPADLARVVALAAPLAVAGLVVQVGAQWVVVTALAPGRVVAQLFGFFLGQARALGAGARVHAAAVLAPFFGNAVWACVLLRLGRRAGRGIVGRAFRLGALQAATVPLALVGFMVLSIVTHDRAAPGVPRFDVWHAWTYLLRAALVASFETESLPTSSRLASVALTLGMPIVVARLWFAAERDQLS